MKEQETIPYFQRRTAPEDGRNVLLADLRRLCATPRTRAVAAALGIAVERAEEWRIRDIASAIHRLEHVLEESRGELRIERFMGPEMERKHPGFSFAEDEIEQEEAELVQQIAAARRRAANSLPE